MNYTPMDTSESYLALKSLSAAQLRRMRVTLSATELAHETWIRLLPSAARNLPRSQFLALASRAIRATLFDYLRARLTAKRGAGQKGEQIESLPTGEVHVDESPEQILQLCQVVQSIEREQPEVSKLIELRCFGGLSIEEAAACLGCSVPTAVRRWRFAKALVYKELGNSETAPEN